MNYKKGETFEKVNFKEISIFLTTDSFLSSDDKNEYDKNKSINKLENLLDITINFINDEKIDLKLKSDSHKKEFLNDAIIFKNDIKDALKIFLS
jgi:hypothetical protein